MGNRIAQLRKELGLSQAEFGDRLGLGKSAISRMENGVMEPTKQTLKFICREFNVDYLWLTQGKGDMFRDDQRDIYQLVDIIMADASESEKQAFRGIAGMDAKYWIAINDFFKHIKE